MKDIIERGVEELSLHGYCKWLNEIKKGLGDDFKEIAIEDAKSRIGVYGTYEFIDSVIKYSGITYRYIRDRCIIFSRSGIDFLILGTHKEFVFQFIKRPMPVLTHEDFMEKGLLFPNVVKSESKYLEFVIMNNPNV